MNRIWLHTGIIALCAITLALCLLMNCSGVTAFVVLALIATTAIDPHKDDSYRPSKNYINRVRVFSEALAQVGPQSQYDEVARLVIGASSTALDTDATALFIIDSFTGDIQCESTSCATKEIRDAFLDLYGSTICDRDRRDAWTLQCDASQQTSASDSISTLVSNNIKCVVAAPVRSETSANGVLVVFYNNNAVYQPEFADVIEAIAAQVSTTLSFILALEQSRYLLDDLAGANQELSVQATVDGLTGLANHRTMQQTLNDLCFTKGKSEKQVFSLVMLDVDHFKLYNDTHGHQEGDGVLRKVAKVLLSSLRQGDLAARYGGEEFALVLRGVSKDIASTVADRIRRSIAEQSYCNGTVTVSMGVAQFPEDGTEPGEVIEKADRALYHAKIMGRNRVVVWGRQDNQLGSGESNFARSSRRSVLILENPSESCAGMIAKSLSAGQYRVVTSSDIKDSANRLRAESFDIALVSQDSLPDRDVKQLSKITSIHPDMPVILIAENLPVNSGREALRSGASDTMEKPCNPSELPLIIERNLERRRLEIQRMMQKSTGLLLQAIDALVAAIDAKDHYTAGHSKRVCSFALAMADKLNVSQEDRYALELAAKLHDVGKLALPESALNKDSELTQQEWRAMREHPVLGCKIVGNMDELAYVGTIIRHHHERLDGSGYPDGLQEQAIPYPARIIAVADAYEAMTSMRAHRAPHTAYQAIAELKSQADIQYSSEIVNVLEQHLMEVGEIQLKPTQQAKT